MAHIVTRFQFGYASLNIPYKGRRREPKPNSVTYDKLVASNLVDIKRFKKETQRKVFKSPSHDKIAVGAVTTDLITCMNPANTAAFYIG